MPQTKKFFGDDFQGIDDAISSVRDEIAKIKGSGGPLYIDAGSTPGYPPYALTSDPPDSGWYDAAPIYLLADESNNLRQSSESGGMGPQDGERIAALAVYLPVSSGYYDDRTSNEFLNRFSDVPGTLPQEGVRDGDGSYQLLSYLEWNALHDRVETFNLAHSGDGDDDVDTTALVAAMDTLDAVWAKVRRWKDSAGRRP